MTLCFQFKSFPHRLTINLVTEEEPFGMISKDPFYIKNAFTLTWVLSLRNLQALNNRICP